MTFNGDIVIRVVSLPNGIHGSIREDPDGIANIYINADDSQEEKMKTLYHELRHYKLRHIGSGKPVSVMEHEADKKEAM